jgi:hypothetical protein
MNRRNWLRRAALVLALLVLAAIVTGVAESAAKSAIPRQLTGNWVRNGWSIDVISSGEVDTGRGLEGFDTEFSRVTAHRLTVSGGGPLSCSGTGRYRWKVASHQLKLTKIHDACKERVDLFAGKWFKAA